MKEISYKQLESELNELLQRVELADYDELEQLLEDYEQGKKIIKELDSRLDLAKNKITKVGKS